MTFPKRVTIQKPLDSRYTNGQRPTRWADRRAGLERVLTKDGEEYLLLSSGGQTTPQPGWEILLMGEKKIDQLKGIAWTLFGIH